MFHMFSSAQILQSSTCCKTVATAGSSRDRGPPASTSGFSIKTLSFELFRRSQTRASIKCCNGKQVLNCLDYSFPSIPVTEWRCFRRFPALVDELIQPSKDSDRVSTHDLDVSRLNSLRTFCIVP